VNKKLFGIILVGLMAAMVGYMGLTSKEVGLFRKYPKPKYLSDEEAESRPVYSMLSQKEKAVYEALYRGISDHEEKITLPYDISGKTYSKVYCIIEKQEPELFWVDSVYYTAEKIRDAKIVYRADEKEAESMKKKLEKAADSILHYIPDYLTDYQKVMQIHDSLINSCRYVETEETGYCSTAYGCLVRKEANCEGYAKAFDLICSRIGINAVLITGEVEGGENHAWNQVNVSGKWYNIDVTWDDSDIEGDTRRAYFLCDDSEFYRNHTPDREHFEPFVCNSSENNYYNINGLYAENVEDAASIVVQGLMRGDESVEIKFANDIVYDAFSEKYIKDQKVFELIEMAGADQHGEMKVSVRENRQDRCISLYFS